MIFPFLFEEKSREETFLFQNPTSIMQNEGEARMGKATEMSSMDLQIKKLLQPFPFADP